MLTRVEVLREAFKGYFQQERYVAVKSSGEQQGITRMKVNSKFLRPSDGEEIGVKAYGIKGVAWAGEGKVSKIELRFDGNGPWQPAVLGESPTSMIWVPWSYTWSIPRPAQYLIEARATDDRGDSQPLVRDPDRSIIHANLPTPQALDVMCAAIVAESPTHGRDPECLFRFSGQVCCRDVEDRTGFRFSQSLRITHGNHPRLVSLIRSFQCLAVPRQP